MKQISSIDLTRLRTEEDFGFQSRVVTLMQNWLMQESDKAMVDTYTDAVNACDAILKQSDKNSKTAETNALLEKLG